MGGPRSCAIFGQNPMRFAWGFDEEADECRTIIRQADMVLAVYDLPSAGGNTADRAIQYAQEWKRPMLLIHPDTLKTEYANIEV